MNLPKRSLPLSLLLSLSLALSLSLFLTSYSLTLTLSCSHSLTHIQRRKRQRDLAQNLQRRSAGTCFQVQLASALAAACPARQAPQPHSHVGARLAAATLAASWGEPASKPPLQVCQTFRFVVTTTSKCTGRFPATPLQETSEIRLPSPKQKLCCFLFEVG